MALATLAGSGASAELVRRQVRGRALVFLFHRVLPLEEYRTYYDGYSAITEASFAAAIEYLKARYEVVGAEEILAAGRGRPRCAITFDDGWEDSYRCAWPLLRRAGLPATIFLATGFVGRDRLLWPDLFQRLVRAMTPAERAAAGRELRQAHAWLDGVVQPLDLGSLRRYLKAHVGWEEHMRRGEELAAELLELNPRAVKSLPRRVFLQAEEVRAMQRGGCRLGAHTVSHPRLVECDGERLAAELGGSRRVLQTQFGVEAPALAYPHGGYDERVVTAAATAGYRLAFTTRDHPVWAEGDPLRVPRVNLYEGLLSRRPGEFRAHVLEANLLRLLRRTRRDAQPTPAWGSQAKAESE